MARDFEDSRLTYQTGRVIALGRTFFAALFFAAMLLDTDRPLGNPGVSYALLAAYVLFSIAVTAITWRNWWLDARLAAPAMMVDIALFMFIVFSTNGYNSPFYLLFALPLLTAAVRWGWRETARIAALLILLYLAAGFAVAGHGSFEMQRFILRSGHLLILSMLLIWFGIHQRRGSLAEAALDFDPRDDRSRSVPEAALAAAARQMGARRAWLLWGDCADEPLIGLQYRDGTLIPAAFDAGVIHPAGIGECRLFAIPRDRSLGRTRSGWFDFGSTAPLFDRSRAIDAGLGEGLIASFSTATAGGVLILETIPDLSTDHIDWGRQLADIVGAFLDREALAETLALAAGSSERLSLARDVHDNLVQFLAGAAFRVEAMARAAKRGQKLDPDLAELKRLIVEEQRDIREFVTALRRDEDLACDEAIDELEVLAARLGKQWALQCQFRTGPCSGAVPIRLHLDVRQLVREAVANAARHGSAKSVEILFALGGGVLDLTVTDDGSGFSEAAGEPWSLRERVDRAGGAMTIDSAPGRTVIAIRLPLTGVSA